MRKIKFYKRLALVSSIVCAGLCCTILGFNSRSKVELQIVSESVTNGISDQVLDELNNQAIVHLSSESSTGKDIYTNGTRVNVNSDSVTLFVPADDYIVDKEGYIKLTDIGSDEHLIIEDGIVKGAAKEDGEVRKLTKYTGNEILFIEFSPLAKSKYEPVYKKALANANSDTVIASLIEDLVNQNISDRKTDITVAEIIPIPADTSPNIIAEAIPTSSNPASTMRATTKASSRVTSPSYSNNSGSNNSDNNNEEVKHNWVPVYKTIKHPAVTTTEYKETITYISEDGKLSTTDENEMKSYVENLRKQIVEKKLDANHPISYTIEHRVKKITKTTEAYEEKLIDYYKDTVTGETKPATDASSTKSNPKTSEEIEELPPVIKKPTLEPLPFDITDNERNDTNKDSGETKDDSQTSDSIDKTNSNKDACQPREDGSCINIPIEFSDELKIPPCTLNKKKPD